MDRLMLIIEPTHDCNMRCRHCYHAPRGFSPKVLEVEDAVKFFDCATQCSNNIELLFHGGEPTLVGEDYYRMFFSGIKPIVKERGVRVTSIVQTNGLLLSARMVSVFVENNVRIGVSFDGVHNDYLRSDTHRVLTNIKGAMDAGADVRVLCVETKKTADNIIDNYRWFSNQGISYKVLPLFEAGLAVGLKDEVLDEDTYAKALCELYTYWLTDSDVTIRMSTVEGFLRLFHGEKKRLRVGGRCFGHCFALMPDGSIWPCNRPLPNEFRLGDVATLRSIKTCYSEQGFRALGDILRQRHQSCRGCEFYQQCNTGCIANAIEDGEPHKCGGISCRRTMKLLEALRPINDEVIATGAFGGRTINPYAMQIRERILKNMSV